MVEVGEGGGDCPPSTRARHLPGPDSIPDHWLKAKRNFADEVAAAVGGVAAAAVRDAAVVVADAAVAVAVAADATVGAGGSGGAAVVVAAYLQISLNLGYCSVDNLSFRATTMLLRLTGLL